MTFFREPKKKGERRNVIEEHSEENRDKKSFQSLNYLKHFIKHGIESLNPFKFSFIF